METRKDTFKMKRKTRALIADTISELKARLRRMKAKREAEKRELLDYIYKMRITTKRHPHTFV